MTRTELAERVALKKGCTLKEADEFIKVTFEEIPEVLKTGEKVNINGFGTYEKVEKPERKGRRPSDGAEITIPASNGVKFKASKTFKDKLN